MGFRDLQGFGSLKFGTLRFEGCKRLIVKEGMGYYPFMLYLKEVPCLATRGVISRTTKVNTTAHIQGLISPQRTTHEPPRAHPLEVKTEILTVGS